MEYCGTKVESGDITDLSSKDEEVKKDDVYSGITIDGNFSDWNAVSKNDVSQNSESGNGLSKVAAVFDGDYIYIYMKENLKMHQMVRLVHREVMRVENTR